MKRMTERVVFLAASIYDFVNDSQQRISGTTVHYVISEDFAPYADPERQFKGYKPVKAAFSYDAYEKVEEVPGLYELDIEVEAGPDGKMRATPRDFSFISVLKTASGDGNDDEIPGFSKNVVVDI